MSKGLGSNLDKGKKIDFDLNLKPSEDDNEEVSFEYCAICAEPLSYEVEDRTTVTLCCLHEFHLDCIGSAFNAKGKMECPSCRNVDPGRWLYPNGHPNPYPLPEEEVDEEEEQEEERAGIDFGPINLVPPTMAIGSLPVSHGPSPIMFPYGMPTISSLLGSPGPRPFDRNGTGEDFRLSSFGGSGTAAYTWVPDVYDGSRSVDALRHNLLLENMELRRQVDRSLALLADNERDLYSLGSAYRGGESSRTGARRGRGGSNYGGGERDNDGGGGSGNGGGGNCGGGGRGNGGGCGDEGSGNGGGCGRCG